MSLRRKLVAMQVALVALGLLASTVISYRVFRHSQYAQLDTEARNAAPALAAVLVDGTLFRDGPIPGAPQGRDEHPAQTNGQTPPPRGRGAGLRSLPRGSFAELRAADGTVINHLADPFCRGTCPTPAIPTHMSVGARGTTTTVGATSGSTRFRMLVAPAHEQGAAAGDLIVVAVPLDEVDSSLHRLLVVDLVVAACVLLALSAAALIVVRRGLHPLERMASTARGITTGDLSRRVSPADDRTEVGQLGLALNTMLAEIEGSFAEREATEQRLRQFLADASHEMRTPLTSIKGWAELWRLGAVASDDDLAMAMRRIEEQAARMGAMVEELLLLARLDQTRPAERMPVDLAVVAAEACADVGVARRTHPLRLDAPSPVPVNGSAGQLHQAVANLLTNAIRYTPEGTPIEVSATVDAGAAVLQVRDQGPGLTEDGLAHAFDRFWQQDPARHADGAGLGLAIVAAVAAGHGGTATVANDPRGGACFTIRLPLRDQAPPPARPGESLSERPALS